LNNAVEQLTRVIQSFSLVEKRRLNYIFIAYWQSTKGIFLAIIYNTELGVVIK